MSVILDVITIGNNNTVEPLYNGHLGDKTKWPL